VAKFLVEENLSPLIAEYLREKGYQAVAKREIGLKGKDDKKILGWIKKERQF
jgi:predicted nuclease of predicted toxin-antitoxin system